MSVLNKVNVVSSHQYDCKICQKLDTHRQETVAGVFSTYTHSWLTSGPELFVVRNNDGVLQSYWTFGENAQDDLEITCAIELPLDGCAIPLLVLGVSSENTNLICFFNPNTRKILRIIDIIYPVRTLSIIEDGTSEVNPLNDALTATEGLIAVGCAEGTILLIDLCKSVLSRAINGDFRYYSSEDNPTTVVYVEGDLINTGSFQQRIVESRKNNSCVSVVLTDPSDEGITTLLYSLESAVLFVGTSSGSFHMWNMSSLTCLFKSPGINRAIISLSLLEPCDDPRHNLYLWVCFEDYAQVLMYCISFSSKFYVQGYGVYYQSFESAALVYRFTLGMEIDILAKRSICSQAVAKLVPKNFVKCISLPETEGTQLRLFVTAYEIVDKGQISFRVLIFDLNQWYRDQMPDDGISSCLDSIDVDCKGLWHLQLDPSTASLYQCVRPQEQHFHPTSLDFRVWCVEEESIRCLEKLGLQTQWFRNLSRMGANALLEPTQVFLGALTAGLLPSFIDPPDPDTSSQVEERSYILSVCLENRLITVIDDCAKEWNSGSYTVRGCTVQYILDWLWGLHKAYKTNGNRICIPLFDQSGMNFDISEKRSLQHCKSLLNLVQKIYNNIVQKYSNVLMSGIEQKLKAMSLVRLYFECCLKLLSVNLLPEPNEMGRPIGSLSYEFDSISAYVNKRRKEGPFLGDSLMGNTGAESQWLEEGGNGRYPPPSIQSVLRFFLHPSPSLPNKLSLLLYLYMDILNSHTPLRSQPDFERVKNFQHMMRISEVHFKIVAGSWCLDHSVFEEGVDLLLDPRVLSVDMTDDQHRDIINLLKSNGQEKLALQYLRLKSPSLHKEEDLRMELNLLLSNRLVNEAFLFQRKHPEMRETLLLEFFEGCIKRKVLGQVFGLNLDLKEECLLMKYLRSSGLKEKGDLQVLLLLSKAKYTEAIYLNDRLNSTVNGPKSRLETDTRDMIVRGITGSLNSISRHMAQEMKTYKPPPSGSHPKPLSTLIKVRNGPDGPLCQTDSNALLGAIAKSTRHLSDFVNSFELGVRRKREDGDLELDFDEAPRKRLKLLDSVNGVNQISSNEKKHLISYAPCTSQERDVMELVGTPLVKKCGKRISPHSRPSSILKGKTPEKGIASEEFNETPRKTIRFTLPENEIQVTARKPLHEDEKSVNENLKLITENLSDTLGQTPESKDSRVRLSGRKPLHREENTSIGKEPTVIQTIKDRLRSSTKKKLLEDGVNWKEVAEASKPRQLFTQGVGKTTPSSLKSYRTPSTTPLSQVLDITVTSSEKNYLDSPSRGDDNSPVTEALFNTTIVPKILFPCDKTEKVSKEYIDNNLINESRLEKYVQLRNISNKIRNSIFNESNLKMEIKSSNVQNLENQDFKHFKFPDHTKVELQVEGENFKETGMIVNNEMGSSLPFAATASEPSETVHERDLKGKVPSNVPKKDKINVELHINPLTDKSEKREDKESESSTQQASILINSAGMLLDGREKIDIPQFKENLVDNKASYDKGINTSKDLKKMTESSELKIIGVLGSLLTSNLKNTSNTQESSNSKIATHAGLKVDNKEHILKASINPMGEENSDDGNGSEGVISINSDDGNDDHHEEKEIVDHEDLEGLSDEDVNEEIEEEEIYENATESEESLSDVTSLSTEGEADSRDESNSDDDLNPLVAELKKKINEKMEEIRSTKLDPVVITLEDSEDEVEKERDLDSKNSTIDSDSESKISSNDEKGPDDISDCEIFGLESAPIKENQVTVEKEEAEISAPLVFQPINSANSEDKESGSPLEDLKISVELPDKYNETKYPHETLHTDSSGVPVMETVCDEEVPVMPEKSEEASDSHCEKADDSYSVKPASDPSTQEKVKFVEKKQQLSSISLNDKHLSVRQPDSKVHKPDELQDISEFTEDFQSIERNWTQQIEMEMKQDNILLTEIESNSNVSQDIQIMPPLSGDNNFTSSSRGKRVPETSGRESLDSGTDKTKVLSPNKNVPEKFNEPIHILEREGKEAVSNKSQLRKSNVKASHLGTLNESCNKEEKKINGQSQTEILVKCYEKDKNELEASSTNDVLYKTKETENNYNVSESDPGNDVGGIHDMVKSEERRDCNISSNRLSSEVNNDQGVKLDDSKTENSSSPVAVKKGFFKDDTSMKEKMENSLVKSEIQHPLEISKKYACDEEDLDCVTIDEIVNEEIRSPDPDLRDSKKKILSSSEAELASQKIDEYILCKLPSEAENNTMKSNLDDIHSSGPKNTSSEQIQVESKTENHFDFEQNEIEVEKSFCTDHVVINADQSENLINTTNDLPISFNVHHKKDIEVNECFLLVPSEENLESNLKTEISREENLDQNTKSEMASDTLIEACNENSSSLSQSMLRVENSKPILMVDNNAIVNEESVIKICEEENSDSFNKSDQTCLKITSSLAENSEAAGKNDNNDIAVNGSGSEKMLNLTVVSESLIKENIVCLPKVGVSMDENVSPAQESCRSSHEINRCNEFVSMHTLGNQTTAINKSLNVTDENILIKADLLPCEVQNEKLKEAVGVSEINVKYTEEIILKSCSTAPLFEKVDGDGIIKLNKTSFTEIPKQKDESLKADAVIQLIEKKQNNIVMETTKNSVSKNDSEILESIKHESSKTSDTDAEENIMESKSKSDNSCEKSFFFGKEDIETYIRATKATFQVGSRVSLPDEDEPVDPMEVAMIEDEDKLSKSNLPSEPDLDLTLHLSPERVSKPEKVDQGIVTQNSYLQRRTRRLRNSEHLGNDQSEKKINSRVDNLQIDDLTDRELKCISTQTSESMWENIELNEDEVATKEPQKEVGLKSAHEGAELKTADRRKRRQSSAPPELHKESVGRKSSSTTEKDYEIKLKKRDYVAEKGQIKGMILGEERKGILKNRDSAIRSEEQLFSSNDSAEIQNNDNKTDLPTPIRRSRRLSEQSASLHYEIKNIDEKSDSSKSSYKRKSRGYSEEPDMFRVSGYKSSKGRTSQHISEDEISDCLKQHRRTRRYSEEPEKLEELKNREKGKSQRLSQTSEGTHASNSKFIDEEIRGNRKMRRYSEDLEIRGILKKRTDKNIHTSNEMINDNEFLPASRYTRRKSADGSPDIAKKKSKYCKETNIKNIADDSQAESKKLKKYSVDSELKGIRKKKSYHLPLKTDDLQSDHESDAPEECEKHRKHSKEDELPGILKKTSKECRKYSANKDEFDIYHEETLHERKRILRGRSEEPALLGTVRENKGNRRSTRRSETDDGLKLNFHESSEDRRRIRRHSEEPEIHGILKKKSKTTRKSSNPSEETDEFKIHSNTHLPVQERNPVTKISGADKEDIEFHKESSCVVEVLRESHNVFMNKDEGSSNLSEVSVKGVIKSKKRDSRKGSQSNASGTDLELRLTEDFPEEMEKSLLKCSSQIMHHTDTKKSQQSDDTSNEKVKGIKNSKAFVKCREPHLSDSSGPKFLDKNPEVVEEAVFGNKNTLYSKEGKPLGNSRMVISKRDNVRTQLEEVSDKLILNKSSSVTDAEPMETVSLVDNEIRALRKSRRHTVKNDTNAKTVEEKKTKIELDGVTFVPKRLEYSDDESPDKKKSRSLIDFPIRRNSRLPRPALEDIKEEEEEGLKNKKKSMDDLHLEEIKKKKRVSTIKKPHLSQLVMEESDAESDVATPELWKKEVSKEKRTRTQQKIFLMNQQLSSVSDVAGSSVTSSPRRKKKTDAVDSPSKTPTRSSLRLQKKQISEKD